MGIGRTDTQTIDVSAAERNRPGNNPRTCRILGRPERERVSKPGVGGDGLVGVSRRQAMGQRPPDAAAKLKILQRTPSRTNSPRVSERTGPCTGPHILSRLFDRPQTPPLGGVFFVARPRDCHLPPIRTNRTTRNNCHNCPFSLIGQFSDTAGPISLLVHVEPAPGNERRGKRIEKAARAGLSADPARECSAPDLPCTEPEERTPVAKTRKESTTPKSTKSESPATRELSLAKAVAAPGKRAESPCKEQKSDKDPAEGEVHVDRRRADRRASGERRTNSEPVAVERRKLQRRAHRRRSTRPRVNATALKVEFMNALDEYCSRWPTCGEFSSRDQATPRLRPAARISQAAAAQSADTPTSHRHASRGAVGGFGRATQARRTETQPLHHRAAVSPSMWHLPRMPSPNTRPPAHHNSQILLLFQTQPTLNADASLRRASANCCATAVMLFATVTGYRCGCWTPLVRFSAAWAGVPRDSPEVPRGDHSTDSDGNPFAQDVAGPKSADLATCLKAGFPADSGACASRSDPRAGWRGDCHQRAKILPCHWIV